MKHNIYNMFIYKNLSHSKVSTKSYQKLFHILFTGKKLAPGDYKSCLKFFIYKFTYARLPCV